MNDPYTPPGTEPPATERLDKDRASRVLPWLVRGGFLVAVIAVIVAIVLPASGHGYQHRARVSEVILALAGGREVLVDFVEKHQRLPKDAQELGWPGAAPPASKYVQSLAYDGAKGDLVAVARNIRDDVDGRTVRMNARFTGSELNWRCYSADMPKKYLPATCRD
jgi:hypothetical protein